VTRAGGNISPITRRLWFSVAERVQSAAAINLSGKSRSPRGGAYAQQISTQDAAHYRRNNLNANRSV
jgi:hypothetical protein